MHKIHWWFSARKAFDLFYIIRPVTRETYEANMDMKYEHEEKNKKLLNKMSNYVLLKSSHASKKHIPS